MLDHLDKCSSLATKIKDNGIIHPNMTSVNSGENIYSC